ncbi:MAG: hypothetical protein WA191_14535 [Telluria sp.]
MRYPNLRYGNPTELAYYAMTYDLVDLARTLRRDERTVRDWLSARKRVPWWVPEILRLMRMEAVERQRQMFGAIGDQRRLAALGVVQPDTVLQLHRRPEKEKPQITDLRLDAFDVVQRSAG